MLNSTPSNVCVHFIDCAYLILLQESIQSDQYPADVFSSRMGPTYQSPLASNQIIRRQSLSLQLFQNEVSTCFDKLGVANETLQGSIDTISWDLQTRIEQLEELVQELEEKLAMQLAAVKSTSKSVSYQHKEVKVSEW